MNFFNLICLLSLLFRYEAQLEKDWEYILEDSGAKIILASTTKVFSKVKGYIGTVGKVASVLCFDEKEETLHSYSRWLKLAETLPAVPDHTIDPSHLAALIYTSGTTGTYMSPLHIH